MVIANAAQLNGLLDRWNETLFARRRPAPEEAQADCAALCDLFLRDLQFLPDDPAFRSPVRTFTGESLCSATRGTCVTMESLRLLTLAGGNDLTTRKVRWTGGKLAACGVLVYQRRFWDGRNRGLYCCGPCTAAFWRALTARVFHPKWIDKELWEAEGLKGLARRRKADGEWRAFPFWYTLLALSEMPSPAARDEKRFAARRCEELLTKPPRADKWNRRRRLLAEVILGQV